MNSKNKKVRVATRCFIFKDNKIVSIKYKDKGEKTGFYDLPGGKIEENKQEIKKEENKEQIKSEEEKIQEKTKEEDIPVEIKENPKKQQRQL